MKIGNRGIYFFSYIYCTYHVMTFSVSFSITISY